MGVIVNAVINNTHYTTNTVNTSNLRNICNLKGKNT